MTEDLKDKVVVFVGAGDHSKVFAFEEAKRLGVRPVVVDSDECPWLTETGLVERLVLVPTLHDGCDALKAVDELKRIYPEGVDGVWTFWEPEVYQTSQLAEALGTGASTPAACEKARSKWLTRECMREAGLPSPACLRVSGPESLEDAIANAPSWPNILKPASGYNSFHTYKVNSGEEARQALSEILEMAHDESRFDTRMWSRQGIDMVLETFLDGSKVDVELLVQDGEVKWSAIALEVPHSYDPTFLPSYVTPTVIPLQQQRELRDLATKTVNALGLTNGAFNVELKYTTKNGPHIMEVNGRMGGTFLYHMWKAGYGGFSIVEQCIRVACKIPARIERENVCSLEDSRESPTHFVCGWNTYGGLCTPDALDKLVENNEHVLVTLDSNKAARKVALSDHRDAAVHQGWVIASGSTQEDAITNTRLANESVVVSNTKARLSEAVANETDPRALLSNRANVKDEGSLRARSASLFTQLRRLLSEHVDGVVSVSVEERTEKARQIARDYIAAEDRLWFAKHAELVASGKRAPTVAPPTDCEFPLDIEWFNVRRPLSFSRDLRGRITLFDFWTYCCINCQHQFPELRALEARYIDNPGVAFLGVHAGKFTNERDSQNIVAAILRHDLEHPVPNDADMVLLDALGVNCWPTFVIFGPHGNQLVHYNDDDASSAETAVFIDAAVDFYGARSLKRDRLPIHLESDRVHNPEDVARRPAAPTGPFAFPSKVLTSNDRLYISDTGHHRIVVTDHTGKQQFTIGGNGEPGLQDGSFEECRLAGPQGLALHGDVLYIADSENHAIRAANLTTHELVTLAGNGSRCPDPRTHNNLQMGGDSVDPLEQRLSSPCDLVKHGEELLIAMTGIHQIWAYNLVTKRIRVFSGTAAEENRNSTNLLEAAWAQPAGLSFGGENNHLLFVADSESSTVRAIDVAKNETQTLAGGSNDPTNLFAFGDREGTGLDARFQHPLGVTWNKTLNACIVADSYNHRLKLVTADGVSKNWVGTGTLGMADGEPTAAQFFEPAGVSCSPDGRQVFVADTNNHLVRAIDAATGTVSTLQLTDISAGKPRPRVRDSASVAGADAKPLPKGVERISDVRVAAGDGSVSIALAIDVPPGFHFTEGAPSPWSILTKNDQQSFAVECETRKGDLSTLEHPGHTHVALTYAGAKEGDRHELFVNVRTNFCKDNGLCSLRMLKYVVALVATADGQKDTVVEIKQQLPDPTWRQPFVPIAPRQLGIV